MFENWSEYGGGRRCLEVPNHVAPVHLPNEHGRVGGWRFTWRALEGSGLRLADLEVVELRLDRRLGVSLHEEAHGAGREWFVIGHVGDLLTVHPGPRQSRGLHHMSDHACRLNLAPGLDQRSRVVPDHDVGSSDKRDESRLCRDPGSASPAKIRLSSSWTYIPPSVSRIIGSSWNRETGGGAARPATPREALRLAPPPDMRRPSPRWPGRTGP